MKKHGQLSESRGKDLNDWRSTTLLRKMVNGQDLDQPTFSVSVFNTGNVESGLICALKGQSVAIMPEIWGQ